MAAGWSPHYPWPYPPQGSWEASYDHGAEASRSDGSILSGPKVDEYLANYDGKKAKTLAQHHPHHAYAHQAHHTQQWYGASASAVHAAAGHGHHRGAHAMMHRGFCAELHGGVAGGADHTAAGGNGQLPMHHFRPPPPPEYVEEPPEDDAQHHEVEEEMPQLQFVDGRLSPQHPMSSTPLGATQSAPPAAPPPPGDGLGEMHAAP
jgi:hypothetical protein